MKILILTNGEYGDYGFCKEDVLEQDSYDFVICADGGIVHAQNLGIVPDLIVGDFDSGNHETLSYYKALNIPIETFNPVKDETDTEIAIKKAVEKGATAITIYGGVGSRLDHTLGNVHLVYSLNELGIQGRLMNPHNTVYVVNDSIVLSGQVGDLVSLIPFAGDAKGIKTKHLGYPLEGENLRVGTSRGISNYMTKQQAEISLEEGALIVIQARD